MSVTSTVTILFEVPTYIQDGLSSGVMQLWGGVVRDVKGHIVAHLTEGRLLTEALQNNTPFDPALLTRAIGHAQSAAMLASGLGLLNLGVSVAGFAMMQRKLDGIAYQLSEVLATLSQVKEETRWISGLQMAHIRAEIDCAADTASRASRLHDLGLFKQARSEAHRARRVLRQGAMMMLESNRAIDQRAVFAEFTRASAMLAAIEAQCDEPVEGALHASRHMRGVADDMEELVGRFNNHRRDFGRETAARIRLGTNGAKTVGALVEEFEMLVRQLYGHADKLALQAALGLTQDAWQAMTAPTGSGLISCVVAADPAQPDLLASIRMSQH